MPNKILGRFISRAIEEAYMKYTNIPKEEEDLVSSFVEKIEQHKVEFDQYQDNEWFGALNIEDLGQAYRDQHDCDVSYCRNPDGHLFD